MRYIMCQMVLSQTDQVCTKTKKYSKGLDNSLFLKFFLEQCNHHKTTKFFLAKSACRNTKNTIYVKGF